jgi:putative ABC transport system permease protein
MIRNYLTSAWRNLKKYRGYTFINILGLALGMACVVLILNYVQHETSYDKFHDNSENIHLLNIQFTNPQSGETSIRGMGPYRLADELEVDFPDIEHIIRFVPQNQELVEYGDKQFLEENLTFVDEEVFQVFSFPLLVGSPTEVLKNPFSVVVSEKSAQKYFGTTKAIGEVLRIRGEDFVVSGIMEDIPKNSQFQFEVMVSLNCGPQIFSRIVLENWGEITSWTFVSLPDDKLPIDYTARLSSFTEDKLSIFRAGAPIIGMSPLSRLYLHSQDILGWVPGGDINYVLAFSFIAFFILLIACINFMNLATARSSLRAREVGLRKVVGANRSQLIGQFLSESIILAIVSLILALIVAFLALPFFNQLANKEMTLSFSQNLPMVLGLISITIFVGVVAGSYPALMLSGFKPIDVFSSKIKASFKGASFRKSLVTFQFAISIFLLIVTAVVFKQLNYCTNIDLGFDKDHLIIFSSPDLEGEYDQFQAQLLSNPKIVNAAASSRVPPGRLSSSLPARPEGVPEDEQRGMQTVWTDFDFIETLGFEMASGRSFSRDFSSDAQSGFIINEAAVNELGWTNESAIGKTFGSSEIKDFDDGQWQLRDGKIIGVLKDFHFESLKSEIIPTVYFIAPYMAWNYVVRVQPDDIPNTIKYVEEVWDQFHDDAPFEYSFVDENYAQLYDTEQRQGKIFSVFAMLAIFIACLGLVGLASFSAERKKKEVGIRKVLGASSYNLIYLLSKEFTILVIIAFIVAAPLGWYIMDGWLQDFVYRTPIGISVFILAGVIALLIAWMTVGYQTLKAALMNPVQAIHYE